MFTTIRARIRLNRDRREARDRYDTAVHDVNSLLWNHDYRDRAERVRALNVLVGACRQMADDAGVIDPGGRDCDGSLTSARHQYEVSLALLVLAAEDGDFQRVRRNTYAWDLWAESVVEGEVAALRDAPTVMDKGHRLLDLCNVMPPQVPDMAVELFTALANAWLTSGGSSWQDADALLWPTADTTL